MDECTYTNVKMDNKLILNVRFRVKKHKNLFQINLLLLKRNKTLPDI